MSDPASPAECPSCEKTGLVRGAPCVVCGGTGSPPALDVSTSPTHLLRRIEMLERRMSMVCPERARPPQGAEE